MDNNNQNDIQKDELPIFGFEQLWTLFVLNWYWFVISLVGCVLIAFLYLWFTPTTVSVTGKMQIIDKSKQSANVSAGMAVLRSLPVSLGSSLGGSSGIDSEKEILLSNTLVRQVVKDLGIQTEYRLCKWGKKTLLYQNQPVNVAIDPAHLQWLDSELPLTSHQITLYISKNSKGYTVETTLTENKVETDLPDQTFTALPAVIKTEAGTLTLTENNLTAKQARAYEGGYTLQVTINPPTKVAANFLGRIDADPPSKNVMNILDITLQDENVIRGIDFVNHLVEAYNQRANDEKNEAARKTDEFVNERLAKIDAELGSSDAAWETSKKNFQITDPSIDAQAVMTKKNLYETQLVEIGTQLQIHDYLSAYINDPSNLYQMIPLSLGTNVGGGEGAVASQNASLIARHNNLVSQRNDLLKSVSEMSPMVQKVTQSIQDLHPNIQIAMKRDRESILMKQNAVQREYSKYLGRVNNAPLQERVLTEIGRQREIKQGVYLLMLQKREETAMDLANTTDKGKFIDEVQPEKNSAKPKKKMVILAALFLGAVLPMGILYLLQMFKQRIDTRMELEMATNLPVLGEIPLTSNDEALRTLRTNLLLNLQEGQKTILVTSKNEGDGKTFIAQNLTDTLNAIGKKTLLVNGDLRKSGKGAHPADILAGEGFAAQIAQAKSENDYVIFDSPALAQYADAYQLAQFADITLFVAKAEKTDKSTIDALSHDSKLPNPGIILNAIDMTKKKYKYFYKNATLVALMLLGLSSCVSTKDITYFQNKDEIDATLSRQLYDAKIMPKDILQIQVFSMTPEASEPFNLLKTKNGSGSSSSSTSSTSNQASVYNYLVDNDGNVDMPIIGVVHLGGLTKNEAEQFIMSKIKPYLAENEKPVVHVRMVNYKFAVLGGVNKPGLYTTQNEKVSILEAIAQAGDLTTFAYRDRIYMIRENSDGQKEFHQLNIHDASIINSPYYYLQQNDVIYVEQKKIQARNAFISANTSIWFSLTSSLMSIATFILALTK